MDHFGQSLSQKNTSLSNEVGELHLSEFHFVVALVGSNFLQLVKTVATLVSALTAHPYEYWLSYPQNTPKEILKSSTIWIEILFIADFSISAHF